MPLDSIRLRPQGGGTPLRPAWVRLFARTLVGDGCWEFTGTTTRKGYGQVGSGGKRGPIVYGHRVSWELFNGPIPAGLWVLHHCDNPRCVRPDHLFLGTVDINNADMKQKGRNCYGEQRPEAKLREMDVLKIRALGGAGEKQRILAARYGVTQSNISAIIRRRSWKHLP